ncbi:MAG: hypothetical protein A3E01_00010 [Gammaproteobacteria bacterium RIFCSPHIGHO2_12_FULL_63_22]|nr:MAG: hypothetical protein A3E01_00010 [Gammaproteobacteria bacterium RIFCSPHIGHO2_12_FULL_63_22]
MSDTTIYYIDSNGKPQTAALSIIDSASGCHCEQDILGSMDITGCGNVHRVQDDKDDCESDMQRAALAAGATYYADDADAAKWWIDYVAGYNATQVECDELRDELKSMDYDALRAITAEYLGDDEAGRLREDEMMDRLIDVLHEGANYYEMERGVFAGNLATLRSIIDGEQS